jgi:hypothetical protein
MSENTPYNDPLDEYLLGKLSAEEMAAMDASFAADSQLQDEMHLQRDIVHALQEERRLELKNRLNNIEVGAGGFSTAVGLKLAAGVALLGLLGTSLYFYLDQAAPVEQSTLPVGIIELPLEQQPLTYTIPAQPAASNTALPETAPGSSEATALTVPDRAAARPKTAASQADRTSRETAAVTTKDDRATVTRPQVQVQKPTVLSEFKETDITSNTQAIEAPVDAMARNQQFSTQTIEVTAQIHDKWDFHYRFFDSKLFIYGDFKSKPYEILEINTDGTTSYFLYFENNYYALKRDQQKLTRLRKLSNEKLIRELEITRSQKINIPHN